jgi:hypothetical protein
MRGVPARVERANAGTKAALPAMKLRLSIKDISLNSPRKEPHQCIEWQKKFRLNRFYQVSTKRLLEQGCRRQIREGVTLAKQCALVRDYKTAFEIRNAKFFLWTYIADFFRAGLRRARLRRVLSFTSGIFLL